MIVPAGIYVTIVLIGGASEATHGWGIPMATDIAFSVGIVALLGSRVSMGAKLFLLALAIVDDIGAIIVIAVFYTDDLNWWYLLGGVVGLLAIYVARRAESGASCSMCQSRSLSGNSFWNRVSTRRSPASASAS